MTKASKKTPQNAEIAREAVTRCVGNFRKYGWKTPAALARLPHFTGRPSRIRALFYDEGVHSLSNEARHRTVIGICRARKFLIQWLRDSADELERVNSLEEANENQRALREWRDAQCISFGRELPGSIG